MSNRWWRNLVWAGAAVMLIAVPAIAQEKKAPAQRGGRAAAADKEKEKPRGRLPAYYAQLVNQEQRENIYKIQADYAGKIAELQKQLDALIKERDEKIAAVLSPEQRAKLAELQAAAKKNRKVGSSGGDKPIASPPKPGAQP
jgi:hypothetical protein